MFRLRSGILYSAVIAGPRETVALLFVVLLACHNKVVRLAQGDNTVVSFFI
jgi:hypothetical protein